MRVGDGCITRRKNERLQAPDWVAGSSKEKASTDDNKNCWMSELVWHVT